MPVTRFEDLNLNPLTLKSLTDMGFIEPTPIQAAAIPIVMSGCDAIGQAQTGTGKTAAFGLPILERINMDSRAVQAIVLCPTRELAIQVAGELNKMARYHKNYSAVPIYGGQSIDRQIRALRAGVQVVIGTPGRILDHIDRGTLNLSEVVMAVLDEADEMLDMGFIDDIREILSSIKNESRQLVMFSATMNPQVRSIADKFLRKPEFIKVVHQELTVPKIRQVYYEVRQRDKAELLTRLVDYYDPGLAMVFVNTKMGVEELKEQIHAAGYSVEALHGDMKQTQRDFVMKRFRNRDFDILVATDVAARGIDIDDIEIVFNYDLPQDDEYYVHRIGRTARAGKHGLAVSLVTMREFRKLKDIERYAKTRVERLPIPSLADVEKVKNEAFVTSIREAIESGGLEKYITQITETLSEFTSLDVAAALLKMEADKRKTETTRELRGPEGTESVRFFVNLGRKDNLGIRDLVEFIYQSTGIQGRQVDNVTVMEKFSFVTIPSNRVTDFTEGLKNAKFKGRKVNFEIANQR